MKGKEKKRFHKHHLYFRIRLKFHMFSKIHHFFLRSGISILGRVKKNLSRALQNLTTCMEHFQDMFESNKSIISKS